MKPNLVLVSPHRRTDCCYPFFHPDLSIRAFALPIATLYQIRIESSFSQPAADRNLDLKKPVKERSNGQTDLISAQSNCDSASKIALDNDLEKAEQATPKKHWWSPQPQGIPRPRKNTFPSFCKEVLLSSWVNVLLVFIPAGVAVHFVPINPVVVFVMNFLAIVPLAGVSHPLGGVPRFPYNFEPD